MFLNKLYELVKCDPKNVELKVQMKYPTSGSYTLLPLDDDISLRAMWVGISKLSGSTMELYIDQVVKQVVMKTNLGLYPSSNSSMPLQMTGTNSELTSPTPTPHTGTSSRNPSLDELDYINLEQVDGFGTIVVNLDGDESDEEGACEENDIVIKTNAPSQSFNVVDEMDQTLRDSWITWLGNNTYNGEFSAGDIISGDHQNLTSEFVCNIILDLVRVDPSFKIRAIVQVIKNRTEFSITYRKAWLAKQKAIAIIFSDWEKSYEELPRVFWAFKPSIDGFRHCRPLITIDGTHLYGRYKGTLLIAMETDANLQLFPLAFAIVENESIET
ncbi:uncharacterized protein LOC110715437 [Chenopodium quinoa]|uniref:uncharacterized protein LOC110715437 n=1 Tax=Chenopodium quinoa TaxID=63459 RepID=UPI000B77ADBE|nr:uncharacterized protein LOC110715437 [Chenopodium quinoa]